jgi:hypothetical protein
MINWIDPKNAPDETWDDNLWDSFTDFLKAGLSVATMTITFTKADGTERVMNCTLDPAVLPPAEPLAEGKTPRKQSTTSMRVFDTDLNEWRSFTIRKVKLVDFAVRVKS